MSGNQSKNNKANGQTDAVRECDVGQNTVAAVLIRSSNNKKKQQQQEQEIECMDNHLNGTSIKI